MRWQRLRNSLTVLHFLPVVSKRVLPLHNIWLDDSSIVSTRPPLQPDGCSRELFICVSYIRWKNPSRFTGRSYDIQCSLVWNFKRGWASNARVFSSMEELSSADEQSTRIDTSSLRGDMRGWMTTWHLDVKKVRLNIQMWGTYPLIIRLHIFVDRVSQILQLDELNMVVVMPPVIDQVDCWVEGSFTVKEGSLIHSDSHISGWVGDGGFAWNETHRVIWIKEYAKFHLRLLGIKWIDSPRTVKFPVLDAEPWTLVAVHL